MNPEITGTDRFIDRVAEMSVLDRVADALQPPLRTWLDGDGPTKTPLKDALHGTWLGHALHPVLTDVPLGAWTVTAVCDTLRIAGVKLDEAADTSLSVGLLAAFGTVATGWVDWSDTKDEPRRLGIAHAALNGAAVSSYLLSLVARRSGKRGLGVALGLVGYSALGLAAYLGGELSLGMHLGVKHTGAPLEPPADFTAVLDESELADGAFKRVDLAGIPVLVARVANGLHAVSAVCTHRGALLDEGVLEGECIRCPWHGSRFSLEDGSVIEGPATFPLAEFETRVIGGKIELRLAYVS